MPEIRIERPDAGVAVIRLDAPERKHALVGEMARELTTAVRDVDQAEGVGAVVITGGPDAFCAGAHLELLAAVAAGDAGAERDIRAVYEVFDAVRAMETPTIAAVCGPAVGAGLNLALACGVRLVGDNAYLRSMFVANSIHPAGGHLQMLQEVGGRALAVRMAVLDQPLDADAAVAAGVAIAAHPAAEVEEAAVALASRAACEPTLARWINRSIAAVHDLDAVAGAQFEAAAQRETLRAKAKLG